MSEINSAMTDEQLSISVFIPVIRDILKRWVLIIAAAVIAAMGAFVVSDFIYSPQYRTAATFAASFGNAENSTFSNLSAANGFAAVFAEVLNSSLLQETVMKEMGITDFDGTISAAVIPETNLVDMEVTGFDPQTVFLMAKAIIKHHGVVTEDILGGTVIEVLRQPEVPTEPVNDPETQKKMILAAAIAAAAVCGMAAAASFTADKIRSRTEAENKLGCRVIGEIYHEKKKNGIGGAFGKKKKSILITNPATSFIYTESIHKISGRIDRFLREGEKVITVTSLLENEGKSTAAVNLALFAAKKGKKALIIDCDFRKPACHLILNVPNDGAGTIGVLRGEVSVLEEARFIENGKIHILTAKKSLKTAANLINSPAMEKMIEEAKKDFDYIIIDTPPMSMASDAECISDYADGTILIIRQNEARVPELEGAVSVLGKSDSRFIGCILNDVYGSGDFSPVLGYGKCGSGRARENSDEERE